MLCSKGGACVELPAPLGGIPLHMKGGTAIAMAAGGSMTTSQAKRSPLTVVVALPSLVTEGPSSEQQGAMTVTGTMYNDDGESIEVRWGTGLACSCGVGGYMLSNILQRGEQMRAGTQYPLDS